MKVEEAYNLGMRRWSVAVGRVFGVEVRMHLFFPLLLSLAMAWSVALQLGLGRGVVLWVMLLLAVAVREIAKGLASAAAGLETRSVMLLPTGGLVTYAGPDASGLRGRAAMWVRLAGALANGLTGLAIAGLVLAVVPQVDLFSLRWVSPAHLLRALVWLNLLLGAINLLPAWPLDGALAVTEQKGGGTLEARARHLRGPAIALAVIVLGLVLVNFWLITAGLTLLMFSQMEREGGTARTGADRVKVRDVMLTEYSLLSASATLEDAVEQSRHTLQDVFPVVRGGNMVGAISRAEVMHALGTRGNGYVQGLMAKVFQTAAPGDSLVETLARATGRRGDLPGKGEQGRRETTSSQMIPVVEGERVVGILTAHHLQRSMSLMALAVEARALKQAEDESR